ncbi:hypothetical protein H8A95_18455 [Bradyrhizobium sp. Pear76]|nr:hypothetical protein [Bradyrhizobium oropedii]
MAGTKSRPFCFVEAVSKQSHCERSEAIHLTACVERWIASAFAKASADKSSIPLLAMTAEGRAQHFIHHPC